MLHNFCLELNNYLQQSYTCEEAPATCNKVNNTITALQPQFDLYLRYKPQNKNILIIARIAFENQKQGHGTRLLKFISEEISKHDIDTVCLESVNTDSLQFGKRLAFTDIQNGNMTISAEKLKGYFI